MEMRDTLKEIEIGADNFSDRLSAPELPNEDLADSSESLEKAENSSRETEELPRIIIQSDNEVGTKYSLIP